MKKLSVFLALCLLCCLSLYAYACSETWLSIAELQAQLPQRWTETFSAQYPTVIVDVQPTAPDVHAMPVLKVRPAFWIPTANTEVAWRAEGIHFDEGGDAFILEALDGSGVVQSRNVSSVSEILYGPFTMETPYAPRNNLTISAMLAQLQSIMKDADPQHFGIDTTHLFHIRVTSFVNQRTDEAVLPGTLSMDVLTTLRGVPIFDHVLASVPTHRDDEMTYHPALSFTMRSESSYDLMGRTVYETAEITPDIPLCSFDAIRAAIAQEIDAGHIRAVYGVDLGYALYNVPGVTRAASGTTKAERRAWLKSAAFYAAPTWRCVCLYSSQPGKPLSEKTMSDPYPSLYFKTLFINAQTGELIDPEDGRKGCGDYPGVIVWSEVE